uniref:MARVEL domain-containing protein n=1 Tax=Acrobeloides nanus TaxID=290746 RepID=A0A914C8D5_9BILA
MVALNTHYLGTNRGIIKVLQIIIGIVISSLLCANWYGGKGCFETGQLGFVSGLNSVIIVINIVLFILNLIDLGVWKLERLYSVISAILFLVAVGILVWYIIKVNDSRGWRIPTLIFVIVEFVLFLWDIKILQGESPN